MFFSCLHSIKKISNHLEFIFSLQPISLHFVKLCFAFLFL